VLAKLPTGSPGTSLFFYRRNSSGWLIT